MLLVLGGRQSWLVGHVATVALVVGRPACAKTRPNAWQCVGTGLHCRLRFQAVSERVTGVEPATLCLARLSAPVTSPPLHPPSPPYLAVRPGARGTDGLGGKCDTDTHTDTLGGFRWSQSSPQCVEDGTNHAPRDSAPVAAFSEGTACAASIHAVGTNAPSGNASLSRLFERGDYLCHRETTLPEGARTSWHGATVVAAYFRKPPEENGPSPREHNPERASQRRPQSLRTTA